MLNTQVFAEHAHTLARAGLAVLPANGKSPAVRGFNRWRNGPGGAAIDKMAERHPTANIAYIAGLSRTRRGAGLVVVDADDPVEVGWALETFGHTPARVKTRRGEHLLYAAGGIELGTVSSLRSTGHNVDLKHGTRGAAIVIAPPSVHSKDATFSYSWSPGSGPEAVRDAPPFRIDALRRLLDKAPPHLTPEPPPAQPVSAPASREFRAGSRKLGLNDHLVSRAGDFGSPSEMLAYAREWNAALPADCGLPPMDADEVMLVVATVFADAEKGKIEMWRGGPSRLAQPADEALRLGNLVDADAFLLLHILRGQHSRRNLPFAVAVRAMAKTNVIGGWGEHRYRIARDRLLQHGLLIEVTPATRTTPAQYRLSDR